MKRDNICKRALYNGSLVKLQD